MCIRTYRRCKCGQIELHRVFTIKLTASLFIRPLQFQKRSYLFIRTHDETFSVPQCASTIQIVRPLKSKADTQPQLQPAFLRLSAIISQGFI